MKDCQQAGLHVFVIFILFTATAANDKTIIAIKDEAAFLPCRAFNLAKKIPGTVTLIRWLHSSFHKPLYTLDLRRLNTSLSTNSTLLHEGRHFPSPETEGRLYLDLMTDPIILRIDPVSPVDAGVYTCQIDFRHWRSVDSSLELEIIVPPKDAVIRNSKGLKEEGIIGPFRIGQSVSLKCESLGGHPTPLSIWRSNGQDFQRVTVNGSVLTIHSLQRQDQWSHHTCTVQNNNMTAPKSVTVIIELILPPLELLLHSNTHRPFTSGQNVQISCQSFGSYPKAHVLWTKNDQPLKSDERVTENGNVTTSIIEFIAQAMDDGEEVECMAFNPDLKDHILRRTFIIRVHYKPEVQIAILSNQSQLSEGNNLALLCNVKANPEAYKITWYFNNEIINSSSVFVIQKTLHINELKRSHSGKYECVAVNDKGEQNASVTIAVKHRPVCRQTDVSHNNGTGRDHRNVTCNLVSHPADVTFYWTLRNSSSNHSWSTGQIPHTRVELQKSNSELLCWGRNEIGVQLSPCRILLMGDPEKNMFYLHIMIVLSCGLVICCVAIFFVARQHKFNYDLNSESSDTEMSHLGDRSCGKLISNCVNSPDSKADSECSTNLLESSKKKSESSISEDSESL